MSATVRELLDEIVPAMYADMVTEMNMPLFTNMARSNQCDVLTSNLYQALYNRGLEVRREHHLRDDGRWHYLIAHEPVASRPSAHDVVTDLNPWQYMTTMTASGFLHGERREIQQILMEAGAPEWVVSLRGVETIAKAHVLGSRKELLR